MEWMEHGICRQVDPELFFPQKGENDKTRKAKRICAKCPVQSECLSWAIGFPDMYGIVGGTTERERTELRRLSRIGVAV